MTVKERLSLFVITKEGTENLFRCKRRGKRQQASGDSFSHAHQVRRDPGVLAGEHLARSAESYGNLIGNQQDVILATETAKSRQILDRLVPHSRSALHQRFHN